jgi:hypothetical protein
MTAPFQILNSLTAASSFAQAEAAEAADLTRDIHAHVAAAVSERSGKRLTAALKSMATSSPSGTLAALSEARAMADDGRARVEELEAMRRRLCPLRERLNTAIAVFGANLERPTLSADMLEEVSIRSLLENRISHFAGLIGGLERCGLLLDRLFATETLAEDQLMTFRDATTPIAVQGASLVALAELENDMSGVGDEIDAFCDAVIVADTVSLRKLTNPSVPEPGRRLFGRQRNR